MRNLDFSSWQALLSTMIGLALITLIGVGVRLLAMQTIQQRRERENRQINERLRTLIAAYKTLGGSFTGDLEVDPTHLRDLRRKAEDAAAAEEPSTNSDRSRRMRDTVEAALSDVILLGTEEQVRLAAKAASELVAGHAVPVHELVVSLRDFVRSVLDLDAVPGDLAIPKQGPSRTSASTARGKSDGGLKDEARAGGKGGGGMAAGAGGLGMGLGLGAGTTTDDEPEHHH